MPRWETKPTKTREGKAREPTETEKKNYRIYVEKTFEHLNAVKSYVKDRNKAVKFPFGQDSAGMGIEAHRIPGKKPDKVALVVAGVHGSEQSAIEVANRLVKNFADPKTPKPYFTVIIIPELFPKNAKTRLEWTTKEIAKRTRKIKQGAKEAKKIVQITQNRFASLRDAAGDEGRITVPGRKPSVDPNRQFPQLEQEINEEWLKDPFDSMGRIIEPSNVALLACIKTFQPERIVSIHAVKKAVDRKGKVVEQERSVRKAGVYADPPPRTILANQTELAAEIGGLATKIEGKLPKATKDLIEQARKKLIAGKLSKHAGSLAGTADDKGQAANAKRLREIITQLGELPGDMRLAEDMSRDALETAKTAEGEGARVAGNKLAKKPTSLYPGQDPDKAKGQIAKENRAGVTLGQWGPAVGIGVITVEVAEQYTSGKDALVKDANRASELEAHADAIREILLGKPDGTR